MYSCLKSCNTSSMEQWEVVSRGSWGKLEESADIGRPLRVLSVLSFISLVDLLMLSSNVDCDFLVFSLARYTITYVGSHIRRILSA